ncbi:MAG: polysaccharide deacetylase family protein [Sphingomonas sp.]
MSLFRFLVVIAALVGAAVPVAVAVDVLPHSAPTVPDTRKMIALSFDDVPRAPGAFYTKEERTRGLIAGLHAAGVSQVAFFLNPGRIANGDGAAERIAAYTAAGHVLGDHSFSHHDLSSMSADAFLADIDKAEAWLKGRPGYRPWFRFPGLNQGGRDQVKRRAVLAGLARRGLLVAPVTIDGSDWYLERLALDAQKAGKPIDDDALRDLYVETMVKSSDFADALMRRMIDRSPAHVILLHETDLAARYIGPLIEALRKDGWRIISADQAFADPIYHETLDVPASNGTLPEAIAWQKKVVGPLWYERNDMKVAGALFAARVMHQPALAVKPVPAKPVALEGRHRKCVVTRWRRACPELAFTARPISPSGSSS